MSGSLPCILLTGALGSGKTTIIQDLMRRPDMEGTALVVNEFGEVGLDHLLVSSAVETTLLMENGCMCCSLRGDIVDTVLGLFRNVERGELPPFRRILVETTGLADPVPIVRDLTSDRALAEKVHLGAVCTVVDGILGPGGDVAGENQIAQADLCILSKDDMADDLELDKIRERVQGLNPAARVLLKARDGLPSTALLESAHAGVTLASPDTGPHRHSHHAPEHHGSVRSWSVETAAPIAMSAVLDWLDLLYSLHAPRILRMKGLLALPGETNLLLVQGVGPVVSPPIRIDLARGADSPVSRLVLIFRELDVQEVARSFEAVIHAAIAASVRSDHKGSTVGTSTR